MKFKFLATVAAISFATPALAADVITYNSNPTVAFNYGQGNNYTPANAAVLTTTDPNAQLALRAHVRFAVAQPSDSSGVYSFNLNDDVNFDYSYATFTSGSFSLFNLLTGQSYTTGVFPLNGQLLQDSQQLSAGFINGPGANSLGFNAAINNTYRIQITGNNASGAHTDTIFAKFGAGAPGAVPEPATWAMMLVGFGGMGVAMRRNRRKSATVLQVA